MPDEDKKDQASEKEEEKKPEGQDQEKENEDKDKESADDLEGLKRQNKALLDKLTKTKSRSAELETKVSQFEKERADQEKKRLEEQGEFKRLYEEEKNLKESEITKMRDRLVMAELKAHALDAGILDLDVVKLIPKDSVKLTDDGVEGAKEAIEAFKAAKPSLFKSEQKATTTGAPVQDPTKNKKPDPAKIENARKAWDDFEASIAKK